MDCAFFSSRAAPAMTVRMTWKKAAFSSKARNKRYCDKCADKIKRQKAAERKRRQRERQKQLLYINN